MSGERLIITALSQDAAEADAASRTLAIGALLQQEDKLSQIDAAYARLAKFRPLSADERNRRDALRRQRQALEAERQDLLAEQAQARAQRAAQGTTRHIAHEAGQWRAICTAPDYCKVGKDIVAFDSYAQLDAPQQASPNVKARGTPVYRQGDMIRGVQANAGSHVVSGTSQGRGYVKILDGHANVKVNGMPVARQDSRCLINCDANGIGGAPGLLVTEQKHTGSPASAASASALPPGQRSSPELERLERARREAQNKLLDFDAADELIDFKASNKILDDAIGTLQGPPGTWADAAAQAARAILGFAKDLVMGTGGLAYEGVKAVPALLQRNTTEAGQALSQLDAQILAENIRLGNISVGTMAQGALDIGHTLVKPVLDPWNQGQYVESITRGIAEVLTLGGGMIAKSGKAAEAANTAQTVAKSARMADVADAGKIGAAADATASGKAAEGIAAGDGVHVGASAANRGLPAGATFEGTLYRAVGEGHDPLLIHPGNIQASHRYTGTGQGGLYFATGTRVVEAEFVGNGATLAGTRMHPFQNQKVTDLLDLSNPAVRDSLGARLEDLTRTGGTKTWRYEVTQPLGQWAQQNGYRGVIAPSAQADGGVNVILFNGKSVKK